MYAITATSYRAINSQSDVSAGETFAATLPQALIDAIAAAETSRSTNAASLRNQADTALANLRFYRDKASPTTVETTAALKTSCRVQIALIRFLLGKLDGID